VMVNGTYRCHGCCSRQTESACCRVVDDGPKVWAVVLCWSTRAAVAVAAARCGLCSARLARALSSGVSSLTRGKGSTFSSCCSVGRLLRS